MCPQKRFGSSGGGFIEPAGACLANQRGAGNKDSIARPNNDLFLPYPELQTIIFLTSARLKLEPLLSAVRGPCFGALVTFSGTTRGFAKSMKATHHPSFGKEKTYDLPVCSPAADEHPRPAHKVPLRSDQCRQVVEPVDRLEYEAYTAMARSELRDVCARARKATSQEVGHILVAHKLGDCPVEETGVIICVSASHRDAAFKACKFVIDELKNRVPIWKREVLARKIACTAEE